MKDHLRFDGRIGRAEFFVVSFLPIGALAVVGYLFSYVAEAIPNYGSIVSGVGGLLLIFGVILLIWADWTATVRRVHDFDKAGKHILLYVIPLLGWIWVIELYFRKGTDGPNRFGDPV